jgi:hypothetical protein
MGFDYLTERQKWLARLVASARGHSRKAGRLFELTTEFIETIRSARGPLRRYRASIQPLPDTLDKHPFAPSIDSKSSSGGPVSRHLKELLF